MRANGLKITMPETEQHVAVRAYHLCDLCTLNETFDVVLLAMKAYDTRWSCEMIKPYLAPDGMLIGMQNAMEAGTIADVVGAERTIGCVIELSSEMFTPGLVKRNTPPQKTWIGLGALGGGAEGQTRRDAGAALARRQGRDQADIMAAKWTKLVVNAMCLGPFAMVGLTLYDALKLPGMRELIIEIGEEAMRVGHDLGYPVEPIFGLTPADLAGSNRPAEKLFDTLASHVGPGRGRNTVLQDLLEGPCQRGRHDQRPGRRGERAARLCGARQCARRRDRPADRGRRAQAHARQHGTGAFPIRQPVSLMPLVLTRRRALALMGLLIPAVAFGAAYPDRPIKLDRGACGRWAGRHGGAGVRTALCRSARPERLHRESHRRVERHRHRGRRASGAGRLSRFCSGRVRVSRSIRR